jgi:hypothetical protein
LYLSVFEQPARRVPLFPLCGDGQEISTVFVWKAHEGFVVQTPVKIEVVAYSGYKANERPLYFVLEQKKLGVVDVVDRWYGEEHDYFKVFADDGKVYLIRWHRLLDLWFLVKIIDRTGL